MKERYSDLDMVNIIYNPWLICQLVCNLGDKHASTWCNSNDSTVVQKYMAQSLHIGLYWPFTNLPFGICAIYFDLKVIYTTLEVSCESWDVLSYGFSYFTKFAGHPSAGTIISSLSALVRVSRQWGALWRMSMTEGHGTWTIQHYDKSTWLAWTPRASFANDEKVVFFCAAVNMNEYCTWFESDL